MAVLTGAMVGQPHHAAPSDQRDGQELSRTAEQKGRAVNTDAGADRLVTALDATKSSTINVPVRETPPTYVYNRSYTRTSTGLNVLLADISASKPNMSITVRALDGTGISGSAKGSKTFHPASTYKLPVAYEVFKRVEAGSMDWNGAKDCFNKMIVNSDNACAESFGNQLGWANISNSARAIGMVNTNLASRSNFVSTSDDQATFLAKLYTGQLANADHTGYLISLMKQQRYRQGIPAGAKGSEVADKVGFIGSLLHDSAIVYGPRGPYVLVIYSSGGSWSDISSATTTIHELMSR